MPSSSSFRSEATGCSVQSNLENGTEINVAASCQNCNYFGYIVQINWINKKILEFKLFTKRVKNKPKKLVQKRKIWNKP